MPVAKVELNILASDPQAIDLGALAESDVTLLVTDDIRDFELKASKGLFSFIFIGAGWGKI